MQPKTVFIRTNGRSLSKLAVLLLAGGMFTISHASAAKAQMVNPFGGYTGPTLNKDDYNLAGGVVTKLLNEKPAAAGRSENWSNPVSGNHGTFTILSIFTSKGMPCRKVKGDVIYGKANSHPRSITLDACQIPSGQWKTLS
jgi:surface antigen